MIRAGPSGIGGVKEAPKVFEEYSKLGIKCAEIPFTYGVWMNKLQADVIGKAAKKFGISLSIHAQYWINLNSAESNKIKQSIVRIIKCCEIGHHLGASSVVFHAGFYVGKTTEETYQQIKKSILEMQKVIKREKWKVKLAPETTGKRSQFGSLDELLRLKKETKCSICIDFAHLLARDGEIDYDVVFKKIKGLKHIHSHFSGIEFSAKGERRHLITPPAKIKQLLKYIKKYKADITIINESPDPIGDSVKTLKLL